PPRPVLADLHRVPEAPAEAVELLRGVVRVDVDSPDDVAGDYTAALEGRTGHRPADAVDLVRQRRVEPLNRFMDEEHAGVGVVEVPHRTVRPVPGVLLDTEVGVIRERSHGNL